MTGRRFAIRDMSWDTFGLWAMGVVGALVLFVVPHFVELFMLVDLTLYAGLSILAMSLAFVWGYGGILNLGQPVFFGLGSYAFAIAALNFGETTLPIVLGIVVPMVAAALLGYFMFWGRVGDVYLAVITLTVSLIFFLVINSMSGGQYRIGKVAIGGYNGIPGLPPINVPGFKGIQLDYEDMFYLTVVLVLATYYGLRWLLTTRFGRVVVSIRENEERTELLGYDTRKYKLAAYVIGAGLAGLAGILFANWNAMVTPTVFRIDFAAQIIVWVMIGGLGTLTGPIIGVIGVQSLVLWLGAVKLLDANIVLGLVFVIFVLIFPAGIVPNARRFADFWLETRRDGKSPVRVIYANMRTGVVHRARAMREFLSRVKGVVLRRKRSRRSTS